MKRGVIMKVKVIVTLPDPTQSRIRQQEREDTTYRYREWIGKAGWVCQPPKTTRARILPLLLWVVYSGLASALWMPALHLL